MAVEQSGAEASPGRVKPVGAARQADDAASGAAVGQQATGKHDTGKHDTGKQADGQHDTGQPELDEVKRKFREALERKRSAHASANAEGAQDTGKVHGSHGPAATRRSFRRKSGG